MKKPRRVKPKEARQKALAGTALLVCAYPDDFEGMRLEGAISLDDFRSRLASLPRDQEVIFYCA